MILHISGLDKFLPPFINFTRQEFDDRDNYFWLNGRPNKYKFNMGQDLYICKNGLVGKFLGYIKLILLLHKSDKVFLHGLFNTNVVLLLALAPWLLPKCYWVIWGGDLYQYQYRNSSLTSKYKEFLRKLVIGKVGHLVTYLDGDVELAREWYGAKGIHNECFMYLSNICDDSIEHKSKNLNKRTLSVLVGNSASRSNNHFESLEQLLPYKDNDIKLFIPLSYGDQDYAKEVIKHATELFGDKVIPITKYMEYEEYLCFLKGIDIAVFNHRRQQGMGNTITLLGMGKTIYMRDDVSQWRLLSSLGVELKNISNLKLKPLSEIKADKNSIIIKSYFSKNNLKKQLSNIL